MKLSLLKFHPLLFFSSLILNHADINLDSSVSQNPSHKSLLYLLILIQLSGSAHQVRIYQLSSKLLLVGLMLLNDNDFPWSPQTTQQAGQHQSQPFCLPISGCHPTALRGIIPGGYEFILWAGFMHNNVHQQNCPANLFCWLLGVQLPHTEPRMHTAWNPPAHLIGNRTIKVASVIG